MKKKLSLSLCCFLAITLVLSLPASQAGSMFDQQAEEDMFFLPFLAKNYLSSGNGGFSGRVLDASSNTAVDGAKVCIQSTCATADADGNYSLSNIPVGTYQVNVSDPKDRYYSAQFSFTIVANSTLTRQFRLVKKLAAGDIEMRIILTWGDFATWPGSDCKSDGYDECPADLDAHLWATFQAPLHVFQDPPNPDTGYPGHLGDCLNLGACLERFDSFGPGPETVAIKELIANDPSVVYHYAVHNFYHGRSGVPISPQGIGARVTIYRLNGTAEEFYSINAPPFYDGELWYLFSMDYQGNITIQNCTIDADPTDQVPTCP